MYSHREFLSSYDVQKRVIRDGRRESSQDLWIKQIGGEKEINLAFYFHGKLSLVMEMAANMANCDPLDWQDFLGIVVLLVINSIISFIEENNAGNAATTLIAGLTPKTKILGDGRWQEEDASILIPGDIIPIKLGDIVPADAPLLEGDALKIDQSALTGESLPVTKNPGDEVFSGSTCKQGEIEAVFIATGVHTFFGKAAHLVDSTNNVGHFQKVLTTIGNFCICSIALGSLVEIMVMYPIRCRKYRDELNNLLVLLDLSVEKPLAWSHFSAEGDVEFKAVLFIPPKAPHDLYESYYTSKSNLKLYDRRVFISDEFEELPPKYLAFLKGIVDSDTLPLNVSREILQQHGSLRTIKKKLIRKALDMIHRVADEDPDESADKEKTDGDSELDNEKKGKYAKFWNEFGKSVKLGIIEDASNRNRLAKLLRFESPVINLHHWTKYIERMKKDQKDIYYITGTNKEQLEKSPFLEKLRKKNYEVIFLTDPVDEYLMQYLMDYEDKKFQNVSKEGLKIGKDSKVKEIKELFKELTNWWKDVLSAENVDSEKISNRLADTPGVVVTSKYGSSANMERIMQSQTLSDASKQSYMRGKRVLEINPRHPIIKELQEKVVLDPESESVKQTAKLIYQTALVESGFMLPDPKEFAANIYSAIKTTLNVSPDALVEEEDETEEETENSHDHWKLRVSVEHFNKQFNRIFFG